MKKRALWLGVFLSIQALSYAADTDKTQDLSSNPPAQAATSVSLDFADGLYARKMYRPALEEYHKFIRSYPDSPELASAKFRSADCFFFIKKYDEAIFYFGQFLKEFPGDERSSLALFRLATAKFYKKEFLKSKKVFEKIPSKTTDQDLRSGVLFYLAKIQSAEGHSKKSFTLLNKLLKLYPKSEYAAFAGILSGDNFLRQNDTQSALKAYQTAAAQKFPLEVVREARFKLSEIYFSQKNFKTARVFYEKILLTYESDQNNSKPSNIDFKEKALLGLAYCDFEEKRLEASLKRIEIYKEFLKTSAAAAEIYYVGANLTIEQKNYDTALHLLGQALSNTQAPELWRKKAFLKKISLLRFLGQKEAALSAVEQFISQGGDIAPWVTLEKARSLRDLGKTSEAFLAFDQVIGQDSEEDLKNALYEKGLLELQIGKKLEAYRAFGTLLKNFPTSEETQRAVLEMIQMDLDGGRLNEAAKNALEFIQEFPKSSRLDLAYYKLGLVRTAQKNYADAEPAFEKVTNDFPSSKVMAEALYGAAVSAEEAEMPDKAVGFLERFINNFPKHALSKDAIKRLGFLYLQTRNFSGAAKIYADIFFNHPEIEASSKVALWLMKYWVDQSQYADIQKLAVILPGRFPKEDLRHEMNFFLGEAAMGQGDFDKATSFYLEAIHAKPTGAYVAHAYLGAGVASESKNDFVSAENYFNKTLAFDEEPAAAARARFEIASLRLRQGQKKEAAKAFMLVAILYNNAKYSPLSLYKAYECFLATRQPDEAQKALDELSTRYPQSEWAKKFKK